ncbi:CPBP family intramembrane glutamic endopeptidase [Calothrix sp. 336/3]|uniref:CPBP family intramembrane glutamic endopeptidase n=1 Tax=Calothrix sp. 336/3 TaxID=1337936 RepID=UPI001EE0AD2D|nr:type II CAAX endopeptidase family protein [Calothrix sp. 336/3]
MTWVVFWLPIAAIILFFLPSTSQENLAAEKKIPLVISLYSLAPIILWLMNQFREISYNSYGLWLNLSTILTLVVGCLLGVITLTAVFSCQLLWGWCQLQKQNFSQLPPILFSIFLIALVISAVEELIFRGFLLTELAQVNGIWLAAIASSVIFAVLHLVWEQRETIPQIPGLWLMGIVLVGARLVNHDNLGLAWGLHTGWVWAIACIDTAGLITYTGKVPEWVTGKYQKPLAGVTGITCLLITAIVLALGKGI